jgi:phosphopantothenoylcysteine decarboxylase / phosphopantothenate---cysteine ligase
MARPFPASKLLVGVSGSFGATIIPMCIQYLRHVVGVSEIQVVMTRSATALVTPTALSVAAGRRTVIDESDPFEASFISHVALTKWADAFVIMPATANILSKAASGAADNLLLTCVLAASCPVVFAAAMTSTMWLKPSTQRNVLTLRSDGYAVIEPVEGYSLWDGQLSVGAMSNIASLSLRIGAAIEEVLQRQKMHHADCVDGTSAQ